MRRRRRWRCEREREREREQEPRPSPKEGGGRREEQGARSKEKKRRPLDSNGTSSADRFMRAPKTRADSLNHVDAFERHDLRRSGRALPEIRSETKFYTISLVIASCTINPWLDRSITNLHTAIWELAIGMATPGSSRVEPLTHPCPNPTVMGTSARRRGEDLAPHDYEREHEPGAVPRRCT
jgi:hypothetical protein